jgi:hypothetical protein
MHSAHFREARANQNFALIALIKKEAGRTSTALPTSGKARGEELRHRAHGLRASQVWINIYNAENAYASCGGWGLPGREGSAALLS